MRKNVFWVSILLCIIIVGTVVAIESDPDSVTSANSQIVEVRLSGFEDASFWDVSMPDDQGVISKQSRSGAPYDVSNEQSPNAIAKRDEENGIPRSYPRQKVLGVKVQYIARGHNWFAIRPVKPIIIEGICQSISCYVAGRNYKHFLKIFIVDYFGDEKVLAVDKLNFIGWRELNVSVPASIEQTDYHFIDKQGIKFNGFMVECDPLESYGVYYIYFDELRAVTDIFNEKTRDKDDMGDNW